MDGSLEGFAFKMGVEVVDRCGLVAGELARDFGMGSDEGNRPSCRCASCVLLDAGLLIGVGNMAKRCLGGAIGWVGRRVRGNEP